MRIPEFIRRRLVDWAIAVVTQRVPDFVIGEIEAPYLDRWYILPPNRFLSCYIHLIQRSDDDRALHDHRSLTLSLILQGHYDEVTPTRGDVDWVTITRRTEGEMVLRKPTALHRLEITGAPALTIFVTGPTVRTWGFQTAMGWLPHKEYFRIFGVRA